jgi:hypothetical protein
LDHFIPEMIAPAPRPDFIQLTVSHYCRVSLAFKNGAKNLEDANDWALSDLAEENDSTNVPVGPKDGLTTPSQRGTIFHSVMEHSTFDLDLAKYKELVVSRALWFGCELTEEEADFLADKALRFQLTEYGHELRETMLASRLYRREWPFWIRLPKDENKIGPILLSGVIDLFYVNEKGHGRLIDYKLSRPGVSFHYDKQLEIYTLAIKKAGFTGELHSKIWYSGA